MKDDVVTSDLIGSFFLSLPANLIQVKLVMKGVEANDEVGAEQTFVACEGWLEATTAFSTLLGHLKPF